jgi:CRISPR-associated exonuclease Cas4
MTDWLFEVTDLKQYTFCPRIVFYRYCLPKIRPMTYLMQEGIRSHDLEEEREERRSLSHYGLTQGERFAQLGCVSRELGLTGRIDLAIATPSRADLDAEGIVVEYKFSEQKAGPHFKLQLAAYALLLEESWHLPVHRAFVYSIPLKKTESIPITPQLRQKVRQTVLSISRMVTQELMPAPPISQYKCMSCEFRRFCNDVVV